MDSNFKDNWQETRENFKKWWSFKNVERPLLVVTAPKNGKKINIAPDENEDLKEYWMNLNKVMPREEMVFENTAYLGEAFPYLWPNLGPGSMSTFLGANTVFGSDTVWYEPCFNSLEDIQLSLEKGKNLWDWSIKTAKLQMDRAKGRYLVSIPDLIENLDILASLAGTQELFYYMMDAPEEIHSLQKKLLSLWCEAFDKHYELVKDEYNGNSYAYFNIWGPGKTAKLQCDISAMISKAMYDEFVLPYLEEQCRFLDFSVYHLDGPDAVPHLDSLLTIDKLNAVQWTAGVNRPDCGDPCWDSMYRKILNAGKSLHIAMPIHKVRDFVKRFGKTGILIITETESIEEGKELIEESLKW